MWLSDYPKKETWKKWINWGYKINRTKKRRQKKKKKKKEKKKKERKRNIPFSVCRMFVSVAFRAWFSCLSFVFSCFDSSRSWLISLRSKKNDSIVSPTMTPNAVLIITSKLTCIVVSNVIIYLDSKLDGILLWADCINRNWNTFFSRHWYLQWLNISKPVRNCHTMHC